MRPGREAWERLTRPVRAMRSALRRWSSASDREFHDRLFGQVHYDPFSKSYPGYLTIRRFADHLEDRLDGVRAVVDLGCGPGEITCEIARRRPDIAVTGIDHSSTAIARATENAARLGVKNVSFRVGDLEGYRPDPPVDLVAMFDSFHHLLDPQGLIDRVLPLCSQMLLIEPAGMWTGQWNRRVDLDWLPLTVSQIRQRLEYQFGIAPADTGPAGAGHHDTNEAPGAEPTENRYALADFQRFFSGCAVEIHGTIAGLQDYGPQDGRASAVRDRFGDVTYDFVVALETALRASQLDLAAKHWVIFADRTKPAGLRAVVPALPRRPAMRGLMPPYGATYQVTRTPSTASRREAFTVDVRVKNTGWMAWNAEASQPVLLSYHWLDAGGRTIVREGLRTPVPAVESGEEGAVALKVEAPEHAGHASLSIELVHEGVTWFADQGVTPATIAIRILD
jgi:SAM-dependent methyltransferase